MPAIAGPTMQGVFAAGGFGGDGEPGISRRARDFRGGASAMPGDSGGNLVGAAGIRGPGRERDGNGSAAEPGEDDSGDSGFPESDGDHTPGGGAAQTAGTGGATSNPRGGRSDLFASAASRNEIAVAE